MFDFRQAVARTGQCPPDAVSWDMQWIEITGLAAATGTTVSFLPQAIKTIRTKNTSSISLAMYSLFTLGTLLWLIYGLASHDVPIYIANGITLVFATIILGYKLRYK